MSGYVLSPQAAAAEKRWAAKGTWTPESGRPGFHDRDNFTTNRVTLADYNEQLAHSGNAVGLSATWACTNLIAGTGASLSPQVMRPGPDGVAVVARDHPLFALLALDPNYDQSAYDFWEFMFACPELQGNAFAEKKRGTGGQLVALDPLRPDTVKVRRLDDGSLEYEWTVDGRRRVRRQEDVLHVRGFGGGPLGGLSPLAVCRLVFHGALAAERAAAAMFGNGARPSGVLSMEEKLDKAQRAELETLLQEKFAGAMNSGRPMLLDNKLKWEQLTIDPEDAQMLESRKFSGEEVCRIYGVPPGMVGYGDKSSNWGTGKEVDVLGFLKFSFRKRLRRMEHACSKQLLTREERLAGLSIKFNIDDLLRGDSEGRSNFYEKMTRIGVMTRNECRKLENLPPKPGGDELMVQMQDVPLTAAIAGQEAN